MKVVVTGAAGNLGSITTALLHEKGHEVVAIDRKERNPLPVTLHECDLITGEGLEELFHGADAVFHLGNHTSHYGRPPNVTLIENTAMNSHVLNAAQKASVGKFYFASTIQVIASERAKEEPPVTELPAHLPLDRDSPPRPENAYALSKYLGEIMLENYAMRWGWTSAAIRYPWMTTPERFDHGKITLKNSSKISPTRISQAFSWLSMQDGARLLLACLEHPIPGYRTYTPAAAVPVVANPIPELAQTFYPEVPFRQPPETLSGLIDLSYITQETGWQPRDQPDC